MMMVMTPGSMAWAAGRSVRIGNGDGYSRAGAQAGPTRGLLRQTARLGAKRTSSRLIFSVHHAGKVRVQRCE